MKLNTKKHPNDDGRDLFENHGAKQIPFTDHQRYCHFDFLENQNEYEKSNIVESRKKAYKQEADPLFLEWQYDQNPEKEKVWRDKVAEIKARYPLPSEI